MYIERKLIGYNHSSRLGNTIKYIVIHDTGNPNKTANALNHWRYFGGANRNASAHYFVDDHSIIQIVDDKNAAWHVGDGGGRFGISNQNSIGIELCIDQGSNRAIAKKHLLMLVHHLMLVYNIDKSHVVRHYDASRKICPRSMSTNNWQEWREFWNSI